MTGLFSWTPTEAKGPGTFGVTVRVTDNGSPALIDTETITITASEVNEAPVLAAIGDQIVDEGSELTFTATATDPDTPANNLTFSLDAGAPTGATIDPVSGVFNWTPTEAQGPGTFDVTVRVTDDGAPALDDSESITISVNDTNGAPVLAAIGDQVVDEESLLTFTATATDPDDPPNNRTFSLDAGAPAGATIDPASGVFSWTPTEAQGPGTFDVTVRVTNDGAPALGDTETITITVNEVNEAPVLAAIGDRVVNEGNELSFTATATDPDVPANGLTFTLDAGAPAGATIDPASGVFSWTPTEAPGPGTFDVTVRVTDDGSPALTDTETITITVNEVNEAPVLAAIGDRVVNEGNELSFTATATDPDVPANGLTFSLDAGAPAGATIDPASGLFTWTPNEAQGPGTFDVTVRVTDDGTPALEDFETIMVTVNVVNEGLSVLELSDIENGNGNLGFVLNGVSAFDLSGYSVSSAGDVNGDGFDDLIVGARGDDPNGAYSGASFVIFGSATDITGGDGVLDLVDIETGDGSLGFVLNGVSASDSSGRSVSLAGDINGDGLGDLIVGADGDDPNGSNSGASFVVFGSAADITGGDGMFELSDIETGDGSLGFVLRGVSAGDYSGRSVSSAGDVNGDGFDDLLVGATGDAGGAGASFVVFGSGTDITGGDGVFELSDIETGDDSLGFILNGVAAYDNSGISVSSAGDVNGDGFDDLMVGANLDDPNGNASGASFVVFGSRTDITGGDGAFELADIETGNGSLGFVLRGVSAGDTSGRSVSSAGDVNGDGFDDLFVGAPNDDPNGSGSGASFVVFGSAADITGGDGAFELSDIETGDGSLGFVLNGGAANEQTGRSVSSAGDVNGDGFDDLIVGAYLAGGTGASFVVFGSGTDITGGDGAFELSDIGTGDGSSGFVLNGVSAFDFSGLSVSTAGDVNGDGFDDLFVGALYDDPNGDSSGASFVVFGADFLNIVDAAGTAGADVLIGGAGDDTLSGGGGGDLLKGAAGGDNLTGGLDDDQIEAGSGNDMINHTVGDGVDMVDGGSGDDTVVIDGITGTPEHAPNRGRRGQRGPSRPGVGRSRLRQAEPPCDQRQWRRRDRR